MADKRVKTVHGEMVDRISNLPTDLMERILRDLPLKDAVTTVILSRTWRDIWPNYCSVIVLDRKFYQDNFRSKTFEHDFALFVSRILLLHVGPISTFHLHIPDIIDFDITPEVDRWLEHVLSKNTIKYLALENSSGSSYKLPHYVFDCPELRYLKLENCLLEPPHGFGGFCKLTTLCLSHISLSSSTFETLVLGAPFLVLLGLGECRGTFRLRGHEHSLKYLIICGISESFDFKLSGCSLSLQQVRLLARKPKKVGIPHHEKVTKFPELFCNIPSASLLALNGHFLKSLAEGGVMERFPNPVKNLTTLELYGLKFNDLCQIRCVLCLIRSSINLRNLTIKSSMTEVFDETGVVGHLEDPNCFKHPLSTLQNVILCTAYGLTSELAFIKLLLDKSPSLKTVRVELRKGIYAVEGSQIFNEIKGYPRASTTAQMICIEPDNSLKKLD